LAQEDGEDFKDVNDLVTDWVLNELAQDDQIVKN
jgi:hypothetical protein